MKRTSIYLFLISLLTACLPGNEGLTTGTPPSLTQRTEIQTSSFAPTDTPGIPVAASQVTLSSLLEFDESFAPLQTGTYIIYYNWSYDVAYMRLDGARHRNILRFLKKPDVVELSNDSMNPLLLVAQSSEEQIVLHRINLLERTVNSVSISIKADMVCHDEYYCSFSPNGNWFLGIFRSQEKSFPYLIDLVNLQGIYLESDSFYCKSPKQGYGWGVHWSPDSSWFYLSCSNYFSSEKDLSSRERIDCFGSLGESDTKCILPRKYIINSISPDGESVAVQHVLSDDGQNGDERILSIIDYDCLITGDTCEDHIQIPNQNSISTAWSQSGQYLVWFDYPILVSQDPGYTTIGKMDTWKNEMSIVTEWAPRGCSIHGLSPDDEWILFGSNQTILSSFSLVSQMTRSLPFEEFHPPHVLGWWVIP